jgi:hypothetical protein
MSRVSGEGERPSDPDRVFHDGDSSPSARNSGKKVITGGSAPGPGLPAPRPGIWARRRTKRTVRTGKRDAGSRTRGCCSGVRRVRITKWEVPPPMRTARTGMREVRTAMRDSRTARRTVRLARRMSHFPERTAHFLGWTVRFPKKLSRRPGRTVRSPGQTSHFLRKTSRFAGRTVRFVVRISRRQGWRSRVRLVASLFYPAGSQHTTSVPPPSLLSMRRWPPWPSTISRQRGRPRPEPPGLEV